MILFLLRSNFITVATLGFPARRIYGSLPQKTVIKLVVERGPTLEQKSPKGPPPHPVTTKPTLPGGRVDRVGLGSGGDQMWCQSPVAVEK